MFFLDVIELAVSLSSLCFASKRIKQKSDNGPEFLTLGNAPFGDDFALSLYHEIIVNIVQL